MKIVKLLGFLALAAIISFAFVTCGESGGGSFADDGLTGTVSIIGNAQVGQTLTADTSELDGSGIITFQWKRSGNTVIGSGSTYTIQAADLGSTITVTVARSDNSGSITSAPTAAVTLPPLALTVTITGIAEVGETLTADTSNLEGAGEISYQWMRNGSIDIGTNSDTYIVQAADLGSTITVTVTRTGFIGSFTSEPTDMITDPVLPDLTGTVSINGTAQVGQTLTANVSALNGSGTIHYQWKRDEVTTIGTNSNTYIVEAADVGSTITVTVSRLENSGNITSSPTATVMYPPVTFNSVTANGSVTQTTTQLTLTFSQAIVGLTAEDITISGVTGVQKGTLSNSGSTYTLPISGFTSSGTLTVSVAKSGYTINNSSRTVSIYHYIPPVTFNSVTANGSVTLTTTQLTLTFSQAIAGLTANDITISGVTGVQKGSLSNSGSTYTLPISGFTTSGTLTVSVAKTGYTINDSSKTVSIYHIGTPGLVFTLINGNEYSVGGGGSDGPFFASEIVIPASYNGLPVTTIANNGFYSYRNMRSITIPSSVTSIGDNVFSGCTGLTSITVDENNPNYSSLDGILYNKAKTQFVFIPLAINGNVTIPNSITSIPNDKFRECRSLTNITIPDSVTSIGEYAFAWCTSLTSITIPDSVTSIDSSAFRGCTGLTSITVDLNNLNYSSQDGILYNKTKTQLIQAPPGCISGNFTIPDSVTSIGGSAFYECTGLTSIIIPASVTSIGSNAFYNCVSLTSIMIPNSVTSIGRSAFAGCTSLTSIIIPNSVTSIGAYAFFGCTNLTSITIPDSVTSIGDLVFNQCSSLTRITIGTISEANFGSNPLGNLREVYFAAGGGAGTYTRVAGSDNWVKQ